MRHSGIRVSKTFANAGDVQVPACTPFVIESIGNDGNMQAVMRDYLIKAGYDVTVFRDAEGALEHFDVNRSSQFDLVITDLAMPKMSGLEFLDRFKIDHPSIPVILITEFSTIEQAVEADHRGAIDYIVAPFILGEIALRVERALRMQHMQR